MGDLDSGEGLHQPRQIVLQQAVIQVGQVRMHHRIIHQLGFVGTQSRLPACTGPEHAHAHDWLVVLRATKRGKAAGEPQPEKAAALMLGACRQVAMPAAQHTHTHTNMHAP